jgi:hypothetical protein
MSEQIFMHGKLQYSVLNLTGLQVVSLSEAEGILQAQYDSSVYGYGGDYKAACPDCEDVYACRGQDPSPQFLYDPYKRHILAVIP